MQYNSTVRLHQLNLSELSGYILQFLGVSSGDTGTSGSFNLVGSGRTIVGVSGDSIIIGSNDYNLANSGDLTNLTNSIFVTSNLSYYPLNSGNNLSLKINNLNSWTGSTTGIYSKIFSLTGISGINISSNSNNFIVSYTGESNFVPAFQFNSGTSTGLNFLYLKDNNKLISSIFNQGKDFYLQGQESINVSNPYFIDLYGSLAQTNSLPSGKPYILGFDIYGGKITSSGSQVLTFADTGYYTTQSNLLLTSGSLMNDILRYRSLNVILTGDQTISGEKSFINSTNFSGSLNIQNLINIDNLGGIAGAFSVKNIYNDSKLLLSFDGGLEPSIYSLNDSFTYQPLNIIGSKILLNQDGEGNIGIGISNPTSLLHVNGDGLFAGNLSTQAFSSSVETTTGTSTYTVSPSNSTLLISGAKTIILPPASFLPNIHLTFKQIDSATGVISGYGATYIDGQLSYILTGKYSCVSMQSDGNNWWILSKF